MKLVIVVQGGLVQELYSNQQVPGGLEILLVDSDLDGVAEDEPDVVDTGAGYARVVRFPVDVEPALVEAQFALLEE